jgi:hypothetical protein
VGYNFVISDKSLSSQSIDQVLVPPERPTVRERVTTKVLREVSSLLSHKQTFFANRYRVGHGMIGTVLIALAGEPLTIFVLIAR